MNKTTAPSSFFLKTSTDNLSVHIFGDMTAEKLLIISSATGVKQQYYQAFAEFLAEQKIAVLTFDYSGIGQSLNRPIQKVKSDVRHWGSVDLECVLQYALVSFPTAKKFLLGHSIGGQIAGLSPSSLQMDKIILVAAQSGYWKYWTGRGKVRMWGNWFMLFPLLLGLFGYLPSKKISGMENLPGPMASQWSRWGRKKDYLFSEVKGTESVYSQINADLTALSIEDDEFAPRKAVEWMLGHYPNAKTKHIHLVPKEKGVKKIGHFGIFKKRNAEALWPILLSEIN